VEMVEGEGEVTTGAEAGAATAPTIGVGVATAGGLGVATAGGVGVATAGGALGGRLIYLVEDGSQLGTLMIADSVVGPARTSSTPLRFFSGWKQAGREGERE